MARKTPEIAEETRARIVRAAQVRFGTLGYTNVSLATIADDAGVTKGALFHYFPGKEELFLEVLTNLQKAMDADARKAAAAGIDKSDPLAAFLTGCRCYLDWCLRQDYRQVVLVDGPSVMGMARWQALDHELGSENIAAGVSWLVRKGIIQQHEARSLAVLLQGALNNAGFALANVSDKSETTAMYATFERLLRSLAIRGT